MATSRARKLADERRLALQSAVLESLRQIKDAAVLADVQAAIAAGNVDRVLELLGLNRAAFDKIEQEVERSFVAAGEYTADTLRTVPQADGARAVFRFDRRSARAEQWARAASSRLITETLNEQREQVRDLIQRQLAEGVNPRQLTLDIVGAPPRRRGGSRVGGILGLTRRQQDWVDGAREKLENLDPAYLRLALRNTDLDPQIAKAIADGTPLPKGVINRAVFQLQENALAYRAEVIARTESITALRAGQHEAVEQAARVGSVDPQDVTRIWDATGGPRTRDSHAAMDGQRRPEGEPFETPDGYKLMYPGDSSLGAPPSETIQCRCVVRYEVDFIGRQARLEGF